MSKELSWADLMNGDFQAAEQPKYYLQKELLENPKAIITRFMDGLKAYLEKDIQKEIFTYQIPLLKGGSSIAVFDITLPNANHNLVLKYNLAFIHHTFSDDKKKFIKFYIYQLQTIPVFCDNYVEIEANDERFITIQNSNLSLVTEIDDSVYNQYMQETDWEAHYQIIQQMILQHPALKR